MGVSCARWGTGRKGSACAMKLNSAKILLAILAVMMVVYLVVFLKDCWTHREDIKNDTQASWWKSGIIGGIVNFFDPLGIGAFAPQTALIKFLKQCPDDLIPGTMNIANCGVVILQSLIFTQTVEVEPVTLWTMMIAAGAGSVLGARIIARANVQVVRLIMGCALIVTGCVMAAKFAGIMPAGANSLGVTGPSLVIAIVVNFILGALMNAGIGLYNPCMVLVALLGMDLKVAFPIMMCSCAFTMVPSTIVFVKEGKYSRKSALWQAIFSFVTTTVACLVIGSMDVHILLGIVVLVTFYTSFTMFRSYSKAKAAA